MALPALRSDHILSERHAQHSHLTSSCQKGPALTSDLILSERLSTYIRSCASTSHRKGSALTSNPIFSKRDCTYIRPHLVRKVQHSHLTMGGTHPKPMPERLDTHIQPHLVIKALHLHPTSSCQKGFALTFDHVGTHLLITLEWICTYI